jgi:hypothetical protein
MGAAWMSHSGDLIAVRAGFATVITAVKLQPVKPYQPVRNHALQKTYHFIRISKSRHFAALASSRCSIAYYLICLF